MILQETHVQAEFDDDIHEARLGTLKDMENTGCLVQRILASGTGSIAGDF